MGDQRNTDNRRVKWAIAGVLALSTLAVYYPCFNYPFVGFDDEPYVTHNSHVQAGLSRAGFAWAFTTTSEANWHPLTWLSLELDATLFGGLRSGGFHLTNVLLHVSNTLLLFWVLQRMTGVLWRSAVVAALFALHPLHVESVAWVAERKDVLSTLFWMLTLAAYTEYVRRPGRGRYLLVALALGLGLLAKPMLVTLPIVLLLLDYWPLGRWGNVALRSASRLNLLLEKLPLLALAVASCVVTFLAQYRATAVSSFDRIPPGARLWNALLAYVGYLGKMIWPLYLAVYYPHPGVTVSALAGLGAGLFLVVVTALVLVPGRRCPYLAVGWLWYLVALVPVIGLVQVGGQAMADRYTYVPLIGIFLALTWGIADLAPAGGRSALYLTAATVVVLVLCADMTRAQLGYWRGDLSLWEHAVAVADDNATARINLASALMQDGQREAALVECRNAVQLDSRSAKNYFNLGRAFRTLDRGQEELAAYRMALQLDPDDANGHFGLGQALRDSGHFDEATVEFHKAIELDPKLAQAHMSLGLMLVGFGKSDEARKSLQTALDLDSRLALARTALGLLLDDMGRTEDALAELQTALKTDPHIASTQVVLAEAMLEKGRYREAEIVARRVLDVLAPQDPLRAEISRHLDRCLHLQALEQALPAFLEGKREPAGNGERLEIARLCQTPRVGRYGAAVRFYSAAFAADPKLLDNEQQRYRYQAACAAAQAASGAGHDTAPLSAAEKSRLRGQALEWLRADLSDWAAQSASASPADRMTAAKVLRQEKLDPALSGVRDRAELDKLPPGESAAWLQLWAAVDAALGRLGVPENGL